MTLIKVTNLEKKFGNNYALKGVSFNIEKGDFVSIFGPNGAGKTTLLKIISTQIKPTAGNIFYNGVALKDLPDDFRNYFGVISHQPFLYENLTAYENLKFYGGLYNVQNLDNKIISLLKSVELYQRKDDYVRNYSRGMLQRLSIARALLHDPEIILLDEPYTGLDQHASHILTNILKEQFGKNKTILMITHNLSKGYELATKIMVMKKGKIVYNENKSVIPEHEFEDIYLSVVSGK
ncbi:ABC transporter ATP-binding protein [Deferribacter autotrophicus]|uniref:ABC transporter ATP-binding protein n=1 Tax=Deferribacter autotrophicus TaxID=500465 RepID=UPI001FED8EB6|nr:ABC transporter ATP-binding protein [Deferribacter autotrophicus]